MYEYLTGLVADVTPAYLVIDVNGVGYLVYAANPFRFNSGEQAKIFVYQAVRDNDISLYGFATKTCLLYTSPSPRDPKTSRMPSSA